LKLLLSILVLAIAAACAWFYLRPPVGGTVPEDSPLRIIRGHRPWRRLGAAICLLVAVMYVLGVYLVDIPRHPRAYAAFWLVLMLLVIWLCVLALRDILYTRQAIAKWRARRKPSSDRQAGRGAHAELPAKPEEPQP
jgi:hypothetical protein